MEDIEKKIIQTNRNMAITLFLVAITTIASIGLLFTTSARFDALESAVVFINDDSLAQIQTDIVNTNENVETVNSNLGILQDNIFYRLNETCR